MKEEEAYPLNNTKDVLKASSYYTRSNYTFSLRLVEVRIPNYVIKGSMAQLECLYDLDGEALYSVKWYKDGNEFYRYVPRDMPPAQTFLLPGVSVNVHNSSDAIVTLREVNLQTAGRFRCEVSGEAPSFQTVTEHGDMVVVSLPDQGPPKISGGRPRYQIGDWVRINCTAGRSKPAVQLSWFINGEAAEPQYLRKYNTIVSGREGLETSVLGLQFRVEQHHFRNGDMKLKCVASLSTFYWRSNEESVEGDRPQKAPVLESRETVYASNSRADPVQGMSLRESFVTKILSFFIQPNAASKTDSTILLKTSNIIILIISTLVTSYGCLGRLLGIKHDCIKLTLQRQQQIGRSRRLENNRYKKQNRKPNYFCEKLSQQQPICYNHHHQESDDNTESELHFNKEMSRLLPQLLLLPMILLYIHTQQFTIATTSVSSAKQLKINKVNSSSDATTSVSVTIAENHSLKSR
uniref:Ig-like domain-containing protein n=1 Tax=Glossina brevipalpis TaxID=37001 RepID=A0A1A9WUN8_9MUSC